MHWKVSGIPVTPYATDGQVDTFKLSMLIKPLADAGVQNIMAVGNTGEFFTLTTAKVQLVHRTTIKGRDGKSLVSATVGRSLTDAKARARDAISDRRRRNHGPRSDRSLRRTELSSQILS